MRAKYEVSRIIDVMRKDAILKSKTEKIWSWLPSISECFQGAACVAKEPKHSVDAIIKLRKGHQLLKEAFLERLEDKLDAVMLQRGMPM